MSDEHHRNPESSDSDRQQDPEAAEVTPSADEQPTEGNAASQPAPEPASSSSPVQPESQQATLSAEDQLVEQTKQQIRALVREIAQLAQSEIEPNEFFEGFLSRVVSALAAEGGAIWMLDDAGRVELQYQVSIHKTGLGESQDKQMQHALLLKKTLTSGKPGMIPPHSGAPDDEEAGNPTDFLVLLGPVMIEQEVQGIVEIFQRPGAGPATQRGYLRFVVEMCEIVGDYLKSRRLRNFTDRESLWEKLEGFIRAVHIGLDPRATAYTIANEARRLIECDRVSVARRTGTKYRITAVSGSDNIDPRASTVRDLGRLASAVAATREPVWYTGNSDDMPPQIENALQSYLDQSHSKMVAVLPLKKETDDAPPAPGEKQTVPEVVGALVVENIEDNRVNPAMRQRVDVVVQHSSSALANAEEHNSLFLMPVWRAIGKAKWIMQGRTLPKTIAITSAIVALILALIIVRADFDLKGDGELQPQDRREVYAQVDGLVTKVEAEHLKNVKEGDVLATLQSTEIDAEYERLLGERETVQEQFDAEDRKLLQRGLTDEEETPKDQLERRPVKTGQKLMTVVNPDGPWEIEVFMSESRMGHVNRSWNKAEEEKEPLKVTYILATDPGKEFEGDVVEIHGAADVHEDEGNTVKIRIRINKDELPELRPGTGVTTKVHCGRRSIGYVWLHDLIAWIQTKILFWI